MVGSTINLKLVTQDGVETYLRCKSNTPMQKLMHAFCSKLGVNINSVRFLFDGKRVNESQTPAQLDMESGDVLDVMVEEYGLMVQHQLLHGMQAEMEDESEDEEGNQLRNAMAASCHSYEREQILRAQAASASNHGLGRVEAASLPALRPRAHRCSRPHPHPHSHLSPLSRPGRLGR